MKAAAAEEVVASGVLRWNSGCVSLHVDGTLFRSVSGMGISAMGGRSSRLGRTGSITSAASMPGARGLVLLMGWLGCKDVQLKRYINWWTEQGWDTFVVCLPVSQILKVLSDGDQTIISTWVSRLEERHAEVVASGGGSQIIIHSFSQTGWIAGGLLMREWLRRESPLLQQVCGMVIDSAPLSRVSIKSFAAGFMTALWPKAPYHKHDMRAVMLRAFLKALLVGKRKAFLESITQVLRAHSTWPQLYIYSGSDHVIPHASVKAWAKAQRAQGRSVMELFLEKSPHVQHMRVHRETYSAAVAKFLRKACAPPEDVLKPLPSPAPAPVSLLQAAA